MAWIAQDFLEYTDSENLHGQSGGSGFSAAWAEVDVTGTRNWIVTNTQKYRGSTSGKLNTSDAINDETEISRTLTTPVTSGIVYVSWRMNRNSGDPTMRVTLKDGGTSSIIIRIGASTGKVMGYNNDITDFAPLNVAELGGTGAFSADTWYRLGIEFDASTELWRANINNGTFFDWWKVNGGTFTDIDSIQITGSANAVATDFFFDEISPTYIHTESATITDGVKSGDTPTVAKRISVTLTDGVKSGDVVTTLKTLISILIDGIVSSEIVSVIKDALWDVRTKPTTIYTNRTKPTTNYNNRNKPTTTWTNRP